MRAHTRILLLAVIGAALFIPPATKPLTPQVYALDGSTHEPVQVPPKFAHVTEPDREDVHALAFFDDLSYAAAAANTHGAPALVLGLLVFIVLVSLWTCGFRACGRRILLFLALAVPSVVALFYNSGHLPGRVIALGPEATAWAPASLHTQTDRSTGLLSPAELVKWHIERGFRVLNVSDKDTDEGGREAIRYAQDELHLSPAAFLILAGEEYHGHPDLVLVNIRQSFKPNGIPKAELVRRVHEEGGAVFLAHPWSKLDEPLETAIAWGLDGIELVNGVIYGGVNRVAAARAHKKAMVGTIDYKFGPHVTAMTLIPQNLASSPAGVVKALRTAQTRVLFAIPGGEISGEMWKSRPSWYVGAQDGLRELYRAPRSRRLVWFLWIVFISVLWRAGTYKQVAPERAAQWRCLFYVCSALEMASVAALSWQFRESMGTIPVPVLIGFNALIAVPLLASAHALSLCVPGDAAAAVDSAPVSPEASDADDEESAGATESAPE
ncbi:MAG: hypothetical protein V3T86_11215 [Planctomycetota bacterium]